MGPAAARPAPAPGKAELRARVLAARDALPEHLRRERSRLILDKVPGLDGYRQASTVMAYASFGSEPDTASFLKAALAAGKTLVLPRVDRARHGLDTYVVSDPDADLVPGTWGIREPDPRRCRPVEPAEIGFVLVPGVAFDRNGGRLGYGRGFYDRLLAACRNGSTAPWSVAAAFDLQLVDATPRERHDLPVDAVLTERRSILLRT